MQNIIKKYTQNTLKIVYFVLFVIFMIKTIIQEKQSERMI
jgi:hypothetical protein